MHTRRGRRFFHGVGVAFGVAAAAAVVGAGGPVAGCSSEDGCGECIAAVECVEECGGEVVQSGCCPCGEGLTDASKCPASCEVRCVESCGGSPVEHGCDACPEGTFDDQSCVTSGCRDAACCPEPYRKVVEQGCVWSCGEGTEPDEASGECQCQEGLVESSADSFGRRVCVVSEGA